MNPEPDRPDSPEGSPLATCEIGLVLAELDLAGGAVFWEEAERFTAEARLDPVLEKVVAGFPARRVWVCLDEPQNTGSRAVAALATARWLGGRGLRVIVLDGDEQKPDLTRWSGLGEKEGWVDLLRFGVSLPLCGRALPWTGETSRLLGVGSFCPAGITVAEASELLERLQAAADFVIISAPTGEEGRIWQSAADVVFLGWDRLTRSAAETDLLVADLSGGGSQVEGLICFGPDQAEVAAAIAPPEPIEAVEEEVEEEEEEVAATAEPAGVDEPVPADQPEVARFPQVNWGSPPPPRRRSSPVFWGLAAGLIVVVGAIGFWWFFLAGPPEEPPTRDLARLQPQVPAGPATELETEVAHRPESGQTESDQREPEPVTDRPAELAPVAEAVSEPDREPTAGGESGSPAAVGGQEETPVGSDADPFAVPVGQAGWALHVYSLASQDAADRQIVFLQRMGVRAVWRVTAVPDKGRWFRVYLGSFPSRQAAAEAIPGLQTRLGIDWAMPARF